MLCKWFGAVYDFISVTLFHVTMDSFVRHWSSYVYGAFFVSLSTYSCCQKQPNVKRNEHQHTLSLEHYEGKERKSRHFRILSGLRIILLGIL